MATGRQRPHPSDHRTTHPDSSDPERAHKPWHPSEAAAIEDYALIGDCHTAALVSKAGSIDWLCWPRFDSPACFAALLGSPDNGRWRITPSDTPTKISRRYWPGTMILETLFETSSGSVALIDFMAAEKHSIVRIVEGRSGSVEMRFDLSLRFEYGSAVPWVTRLNHGSGILAVVGPDQVVLKSDIKLHGRGMTTVASFVAEAGQRTRFVLTHAASHLPVPVPPDADKALDDTEASWSGWSGRCKYRGSYGAEVQRSLLTLKALSYLPTGGIVAAPTTSLPEQPGGERNWDYRYCWLRDATFTLLALMHAGYQEEAQAWGAWLRRSVAGTPGQVQTLYGLAGERWVAEWEVPWLDGYQGAKPVRVGNAASSQLQLDVFGELIDALYQESALGLVRPTVELAAATRFDRPPGGNLGTAGREHLGGARRSAELHLLQGDGLGRLRPSDPRRRGVRPTRAAGTLEARFGRASMRPSAGKATAQKRGSFVQYFGGDTLDASLLLLPLVGFLPAEDPRIVGTVEAIGRDLMIGGLVRRYHTE